MKFFHIADTHLGAIPDAGFAWSEERRSEIWESFRSVVAKADREEVDLLLIAGDLFHRQPLMRELKEVNYLFSTLKKTKVVFIIGNHDYLKVDSYYLDFPWSENVTCLRGKECESVVFEDLDTEVYGSKSRNIMICSRRKRPVFPFCSGTAEMQSIFRSTAKSCFCRALTILHLDISTDQR